MTKNRLEAFSDGVIAIIITIMVLELKVPHEATWDALRSLTPTFLSYLLSFTYVAIYWNNHHHLLHATHKVNGAVLWANMGLLFALSIVPFATAWMGENHFAPIPVAAYGVALLFPAIAYYILARALIALHGPDSTIARAIGRDVKGRASLAIYLTAAVIAHWVPAVAMACYVLVAIMWLVPDPRIERTR